MRFPPRLLAGDEEVVLELHPHWCYLGWPLVAVVAMVAVTVATVLAVPNAPSELVYGLLALIGVSILWLAGRYLRRASTSLVLTNARVVRRSGVLSRSSLEIRLERINELSCHQTVGGRILGSGEVLIEVGGETGVVVLDHVPRPQVVQSVISEQVSKWHRGARVPVYDTRIAVRGPDDRSRDTPPTGTRVRSSSLAPTASAAERLMQLDELRRRGIVSDNEYEIKRQQLLREL